MSQNIDHIFFINLDYREDRLEEIEGEITKFELTNKTERFPGIRVVDQGILGCTKSHLAVIKLAKERGYKNVLILEDDFEFVLSKDDFEKELTHFFDSGIEYDVCMISYILQIENPENEIIEKCPNINRVLEAQTASGYIVHSNYYDKLIELYEWACPLLEYTKSHWLYANDQCWKSLQKTDNWYYFKNRIGRQRASYSDNSMSFMDYGK
jgi:glycosyl transferase family 25